MTDEIKIPHNFEPRDYQLPVFQAADRGVKRFCEVWHRRAGKDKCGLNFMAREMLRRPGIYYYLLPTYSQGRKIIWEGRDKEGFPFIDHIPKELRKRTLHQEMMIELKEEFGGSIFRVVGVDKMDRVVGTNPIGVVYSEYSLMDPKAWQFFEPILLENDGWAYFDFTPRGRNHAFLLYEMARKSKDWHCELLTVDDTGVVTPEQIQQIREQGTPEEIIQQEYFCFPPGTMVKTASGELEIERVRVGDLVLTHAGRWRRVDTLYQHQHEGDLVEISSYGTPEPLVCTPGHPVRTCSPATQTYKWIRADEVSEGDFVVMPRLKCGKVPVVTERMAELVAWFIAEGSCAKTALQITLGSHEKEYLEKVLGCCKELGVAANTVKSGSVTNVHIKSAALADTMTYWCGSLSYNKRIPWHVINGHEELVFQTLIAGDGCSGDYGRVDHVYTTVSGTLARDVQMLAHMTGRRATITKKKACTSEIEGRTVACRESYSVRIADKGETNMVKPQKHGVAAKVRRVSRREYSGVVYNLGVQYDESYVANGRVVHNCSFSSGMQGSIYAAYVEKAREQGRIGLFPVDDTVPCDTFWDIGHSDKDLMTCIVRQRINGTKRIVATESWRQKTFAECAKWLRETGLFFNDHVLPHDGSRSNAQTGMKNVDFFQELLKKHGVTGTATVQPRGYIEDGIKSVRAQFGQYHFDQEGCGDLEWDHANQSETKGLLPALTNYHMRWNPELQRFDKPVHDWSSHWCDALRTMAAYDEDMGNSVYDEVDMGAGSGGGPRVITEWNPFE